MFDKNGHKIFKKQVVFEICDCTLKHFHELAPKCSPPSCLFIYLFIYKVHWVYEST